MSRRSARRCLSYTTLGFIKKMPRLAVIQAEGAAPFYEFMKSPRRRAFPRSSIPRRWPRRSRSAIRCRGRRHGTTVERSGGVVEKVTEQEIADAKAQIGLCGIGCEPASAATLAGIRKLIADGRMKASEDVVAVLTGNVLKDPDYIFKYHTGQLKDPDGALISPTYGERPDGGAQRSRPHRGAARQLTPFTKPLHPGGDSRARPILRSSHEVRKVARSRSSAGGGRRSPTAAQRQRSSTGKRSKPTSTFRPRLRASFLEPARIAIPTRRLGLGTGG